MTKQKSVCRNHKWSIPTNICKPRGNMLCGNTVCTYRIITNKTDTQLVHKNLQTTECTEGMRLQKKDRIESKHLFLYHCQQASQKKNYTHYKHFQ